LGIGLGSMEPRATSRSTTYFRSITSVSMTVVRYFRPTPTDVHVCLRRHTWFDPSFSRTFAAASNHLTYRMLKNITLLHACHGSLNVLWFCDPFSMILILICSSQCVWWQRLPVLWIFCLCLVEWHCVELSLLHLACIWRVPTLAMAQILPLTNPSASVASEVAAPTGTSL